MLAGGISPAIPTIPHRAAHVKREEREQLEDENTPQTPAPAAPAVPAPAPGETPPPAEKTVPYTRLQEVIAERKALEKQIAELSTKATSAEQLQGQVKELTGRMLRRDVAAAVGLPAELADRLRGDDEAALTADATALLALIPKRTAAPPTNGDTPTAAAKTFTRSQLADSDFYFKNRDDIRAALRDGRIVEG